FCAFLHQICFLSVSVVLLKESEWSPERGQEGIGGKGPGVHSYSLRPDPLHSCVTQTAALCHCEVLILLL
ncbi:hypothetical protein ANANG_G00212920, partial [Anguilla anguilla]